MPCADGKPHRWRIPAPRAAALRCASCERAIPFADLAREPWRRSAIEAGVARRSPRAAARFVRALDRSLSEAAR